ncbi:MAG: SDR family oxidoreductase [Anaerolineales bacterium]
MILVTGALGYVGRHLVPALAAAGHTVRVLAPARWHNRLPFALDGVTLYAGTIFDPEALFKAVTGTHTVFHLASGQWWGRLNDLEYIDLEGTQNVLQAGRAARIGRLIALSHIGAERRSAFHLHQVKGRMEELIKDSGLAYTIFRVGVVFGPEDHFVNNLARVLHSNPFFVFQPGDGEALLNPLHIDDLTEALVRSLDVFDLVDTILEIGGPEYLTYNEMMRTVMRVTRTQRSIISLPPYYMRFMSSVLRLLPPRWPITPQWYDILAGNRTAPLGHLYDYTGIRPRRFEDTLLTYMPQRRYWLEYWRYLASRRRRNAF